MFFRKKTSVDHLAVVVTPSKIILKNTKLTRYHSTNGIFADNLTIFNICRLIRIIRSFIEQNTLKHPKAIFALDGRGLEEKVDISTPQEEHLIWQTIELSQQKNTPKYFCSINQALVFQYKLVAYHCGIELLALTSCTAVQLNSFGKAMLPRNLSELKKELLEIDVAHATLKLAETL